MTGLGGIAAAAVGIYAALVGALYFFQRNMMFQPDTAPPNLKTAGVPEMEWVEATTADGLVLRSWYRKPADGRPVVVYFHGNAGNIGSRGDKARTFLDAGYGVMLVGYRGYGGNPGRPSEEGWYADGRAALEYLRGQGHGSENVVLYGESLGTGVAVHLAAEAAPSGPVAAVILEAPFDGVVGVARHHYPYAPAGMLLKDRFDSASSIGGIKTRLLIFHGEADATVPIRFGRRLFAAAIEPKEAKWLEGAGHNNLFDHGGGQLALEFLDKTLGGSRNGTKR